MRAARRIRLQGAPGSQRIYVKHTVCECSLNVGPFSGVGAQRDDEVAVRKWGIVRWSTAVVGAGNARKDCNEAVELMHRASDVSWSVGSEVNPAAGLFVSPPPPPSFLLSN